MAEAQRNGTRKPGHAAFEDAWLGFAVVGLLPLPAHTTVMMHPQLFFDDSRFLMSNVTTFVHWAGKSKKSKNTLLARFRAAHAFATATHCPSRAKL